MATFLLEQRETISMHTADNKRVVMRCTKSHEGAPSLDILPRIRYILRIQGEMSATDCANMLLEHGLVLSTLETSSCHTYVVVLNLSDRTVKVWHGFPLTGTLATSHQSPQSDSPEVRP